MNINLHPKHVLIGASVFVSVLVSGLTLYFSPLHHTITGSAHTQQASGSPDSTYMARPPSPDSLYSAAMKAYDKYYLQKDYELSLKELEKAEKLKPKDQSLKDKIVQIKVLIAETRQKQLDASKALASGDAYFNAKDYLNAKASYQMAVGLTPDDLTAKEKLNRTMGLLRSQKASNTLYDVAVASADKLFQQKEYEKAKVEYENARKFLPGEAYARNRINEIIKIQVDLQVKEESFARYIESADKFYTDKKYPAALADYRNAGAIKPAEKYPQERIKELTALLAAQKSKDDAYNKAIARADQLFTEVRYPESIKGYQEALTIKPDESYPKARIRDIEGLIARGKTATEEFDRYVTLADSFYISKNYLKARENYMIALAVKPKESYPREMIMKAEKMLPAQEAAMASSKTLDEQYKGLIASADRYLEEKSYDPAKAEYIKALALKPNEGYPKSKITDIDRIIKALAQQKSNEERYVGAVRSGDSLFALRSYIPALGEYQNALKIKPGEAYPKTKVTEINLVLTDIESQKTLENQYSGFIAAGDKLLGEKKYEAAKTAYLEAGKNKPAEQYPKDKVVEITAILEGLANQKALDDRYQASVAAADKLLLAKSLDQARVEYVNAGSIKSSEQYPKDKIAEIDRLLGEIAAKKGLDEQYNQAITTADKLLAEKGYEQSKQAYQGASALKPAEVYPKTKISEIDKALAEIARLKLLEEQYTKAVSEGDRFFADKSYNEAKLRYQEALKAKPAEAYPKTKISEADNALAEIAKLKSLDDQYAAAVVNADKLLTDKKYELARTGFMEAGKIKPAEQYPRDKVVEITAILEGLANQKAIDDKYLASIAAADKLLLAKSLDQARVEYVNAGSIKSSEQYPKDKIAEIDRLLGEIAAKKGLDEQYNQAITTADKLLAEKGYEQSKQAYQGASALKPAEVYPKTKISEIDKALAEIARLKAIDDEYTKAVADADKLFAGKFYAEAKVQYQGALKLKPAEEYPKQRITEAEAALAEIAKQKAIDDQYGGVITKADALLASKSYADAKIQYSNALILKPSENYPKEKISEIDRTLAEIAAKQKALDDSYKASIVKADQLLAAKTYEQAKNEYLNAGSLKPEEKYPKLKAGQIDSVLALLAKKKALDEEYSKTVADADKLLATKSFDEAKIAFVAASALKPTEQYPKLKIAEAEKGIARQKTLDDQYKAALSKADQMLEAKNYPQARTEYGNAIKIKPDELYPKDKVAEIDAILAELKVRDDQYKAAITNADQLFFTKKYEEARTEYLNAGLIKPEMSYPNEKIAEINKALTELKGKRQTFDDLVADGDGQLSQKEWARAKDLYKQALVIFPQEGYPKERIAVIDAKIDSLYRANKSRYDKAVSDGDRFFGGFEFDKAVDAFTEAVNLLPMENYPREMISKIRRTIAENAIVDVFKSTVTISAGDEKQFPFTPVNMASRKDNFVYIKIRNLSGKPFNVLMRYGKDKQNSGGVVIRNLSLDGRVNERLISVRDQDAWYREDNNWISLIPQGGDVEVSFIQVSRAK